MTREEFAEHPPVPGDTVVHDGKEWTVTLVSARAITLTGGPGWYKTVMPGDIEVKRKTTESRSENE